MSEGGIVGYSSRHCLEKKLRKRKQGNTIQQEERERAIRAIGAPVKIGHVNISKYSLRGGGLRARYVD